MNHNINQDSQRQPRTYQSQNQQLKDVNTKMD